MKVLFLDIDGVLNSEKVKPISREMVDILKAIIKETDANVVLSTTWRTHPGNLIFIRDNICEFLACTPILNLSDKGRDPTEWRGWEIKEWLDHNPVDKYAIIDDSALFLPEQEPNLFRTNGYIGLTPEIAAEVIKHLQ